MISGHETCDLCGLEMAWDDDRGWVGFADHVRTICPEASDGHHFVAPENQA